MYCTYNAPESDDDIDNAAHNCHQVENVPRMSDVVLQQYCTLYRPESITVKIYATIT